MLIAVISEHSSFDGNLIIPSKLDERIKACLQALEVDKIGYVDVEPEIHASLNDCHNNVINQIDIIGGTQIKGYYWLEDLDNNRFLAISHSVWQNTRGDILDITPCIDQRESNLFSLSTHSPLEELSSSSVIYGFSFSFN